MTRYASEGGVSLTPFRPYRRPRNQNMWNELMAKGGLPL